MKADRENIITSIVVIRAALVNDVDQILLIKRSPSNKTQVGKWELPGGKLEKGELLDEVLRREVEQETGIITNTDKISATHVTSSLITKISEYAGITVITIVQSITIIGNPEITLSHEHDDYRWVTKEEALSMDLRDEVRGALSKLF